MLYYFCPRKFLGVPSRKSHHEDNSEKQNRVHPSGWCDRHRRVARGACRRERHWQPEQAGSGRPDHRLQDHVRTERLDR